MSALEVSKIHIGNPTIASAVSRVTCIRENHQLLLLYHELFNAMLTC